MNNEQFHDGELAVQALANAADGARINSRALGDSIPAGALAFVEQQSLVVIGSMDQHGMVWASVVLGEPGFLRALNPQLLVFNPPANQAADNDPLWRNLNHNTRVGLIIVDLATRRRLRVNGRMRKTGAHAHQITVEQAYPNCPKYIQRRQLKPVALPAKGVDKNATNGSELTPYQKTLIANADTFFVASAHPQHGVDASHRGGQPGFVQVLDERRLRIPDYPGNRLFNTLGNIQSYPQVGLAFLDFTQKRLLQLSGSAQILWDLNEPQDSTGGTRRYWQVQIHSWLESQLPQHMEWELLDYSPHNP